MTKLTEKQKRFADYYIECGNATEAAKRAGYSGKTANVIANENLTKPYIREYIDNRLEEMASERIAKAQEVMEYLTSVMRREKLEHIVVTITDKKSEYVPDDNGTMRKKTTEIEKPVIVEIPAKLSDANKAAELLGKRYGLFTDRVSIDGDMNLNVMIDYGDGDESES